MGRDRRGQDHDPDDAAGQHGRRRARRDGAAGPARGRRVRRGSGDRGGSRGDPRDPRQAPRLHGSDGRGAHRSRGCPARSGA